MVHVLAVTEVGARVQGLELESGPLGPLEADIAVTHCGVCATDIGMIDNEYGFSKFPVVAGHEAVGTVVATGALVDNSRLAVGQRVGVGATAGSCFACEWCLSGQTNLCPTKDDTVFRGTGGAFASHIRASDWRHVHRIPDAIHSADAGPLLCAGATVFSSILRHGVRPVDRAAVVGLGGLGHLAVRFLAAWGCHVTVISSSPHKADDARALGAHEFATAADLEQHRGSFDFMMSTASAPLPWDKYLAALRPHGQLSILGVSVDQISMSPLSLLPGERSVSGGVTGPITVTRQMLDFAARHSIRPVTEIYPVAQIDQALDRVRHGQARYRAVLDLRALAQTA
jgi:uncharacterized zinc-type alcohol dehydrogenase-like protein